MDKLALIILNYNSSEDTISCVEKLISINEEYHIIIVDNQSTDNSLIEITEHFQGEKNIDIIQTESNGGYSFGNNFGIRYAKTKYNIKYVAILNPDVIVSNLNIFERLIEVLEKNDNIALVGATVINSRNEYNPNFSFWNIPSKLEVVTNHFILNRIFSKSKAITSRMVEQGVIEVDCVAGCFFIAKLNVLEEIGYLDENTFLYNEENILGIKLKQKGFREAVVLDQFYIHNHKERKKSNISFRKKVFSGEHGYHSRYYMCKTYYSRLLLPFLFLVELMNRIILGCSYFKGKYLSMEGERNENKNK
ncbi:glycosyltransferase [Streptococcus equinus]|uniref:glycosyltransferase n=1 Tax=Streptococcus equinus TaxID=1335 RepID=UPI003C6FE08E